jgi:hypothetical protein
MRLVLVCALLSISLIMAPIVGAQSGRQPGSPSKVDDLSRQGPATPPSSGGNSSYTPPPSSVGSRYTDADFNRMAVCNNCLRQCERVKAGAELEDCRNWCWKSYGR